MKFLILFLISFSAFASYLPKSKIGQSTDGLKLYSSAQKCEQVYSEKCFSIRKTGNMPYHEIIAETQMKEATEACIDEADCQAKLEAKICDKGSAIKNLDSLEVYCTWLRPEQVMENASLKAAYESQKAAKDQMDAAIAQAKKAMDCGKTVKAVLMVRNASKGLTKGQIKQMVSTYSEVDALLESGSLATAKEEIQNTTADGTLITESDKTALIAEIDKCL